MHVSKLGMTMTRAVAGEGINSMP